MKFLISEEEKSRILGMHQNATSRQYLTEAPADAKYAEGVIQNIMNQMASIVNNKIDQAIKEHPNEDWPQAKMTVHRGFRDGNSYYFFKYGGGDLHEQGHDPVRTQDLMDIKNRNMEPTPFLNGLKRQFDAQQFPEINKRKYLRQPKFFMPLTQISTAVDKWFADIQEHSEPASPATAKPGVKKA